MKNKFVFKDFTNFAELNIVSFSKEYYAGKVINANTQV